MRRLNSLFSRFVKDDSGAFAMMFGLMAVVLVALTGAVVDYTSLEEKRNRAQIALDAATLALQPRIYTDTPDQIRAAAAALVAERLGSEGVSSWIDNVEVEITAGRLQLRGGINVPMNFARLIGVNYLEATLVSEAIQKKLKLEVALVLDNSGSMLQENRMVHLKQAALNAVNILFEGQNSHEDTFLSVVPYTYQVNVGANPNNPFWWIDRGQSKASGDNFQYDTRTQSFINGLPASQRPHTGTTYNNARVDRVWLYSRLNGVNWKGCVESRPYPLDVRDTPPMASYDPAFPLPTGLSHTDTLFVPLFAPDIPDRFGSSGNYTYLQYVGDTGGICNYNSSYPAPTNDANGDLNRQERLCKYIGATANTAAQFRGPNADCGSPIQPMTNQRAPIQAGINAMVAEGGTNIHLGAMWGFHLLSPNEPFPARPYEDQTAKVMILMTDGVNTYYQNNDFNGSWFYSAYGHPVNNQRSSTNTADRLDGVIRLGKRLWSNAQMEAIMDQRLEETCSNAKAAGIRIYSIGLSVPTEATKELLRRCASNRADAHFTNNPAELNGVFEEIASQLAALRISR
ncbi:pilus assembly protein TadG-related protein [Pelagibacterium limicola]|uniref:pilus assembly protein TadG-related protein n=1 Tax=Pelagibacterium limicola TaxID=2791022 RepID=UPI0018AFCBBF